MKKLLFIMLFAQLGLFADVTFDAKKNTILITNFSDKNPCVMSEIYSANQSNKWGKVTFDKGKNLYTVNANIKVGKILDDSMESVLSIKDVNVILNGDIRVSPYFANGVNNEKAWLKAPKKIHVLKLEKNGKLMIAPNYTIRIGYHSIFDNKWGAQAGGVLQMLGGEITGIDGKRWGNKKQIKFSTLGSQHELQSGIIKDFNGILYGISDIQTNKGRFGFSVVKDMTFENGSGVVIANYYDDIAIENCTFRKMDIGVVDYGNLNAILENCTFENNIRNFSVSHGVGLELVDCNIKPSKYPDIINIGVGAKKENRIPFVICKYNVIFDKDVEIKNNNNGEIIDANANEPVTLVAWEKIATENPKKPKETKYTYSFGNVKNFSPTKPQEKIAVK